MKFLVFILLVGAVIGLCMDDRNQRDALASATQERDDAQIQMQKTQQDLQKAQDDVLKLTQQLAAARPTAPQQQPSWFQQRLQQGTSLDPAPTPQH